MTLSLDTCRCNDSRCPRAGSCARYMDRPSAPVPQVASFRRIGTWPCANYIPWLAPTDTGLRDDACADRQREQRARNDEGGR